MTHFVVNFLAARPTVLGEPGWVGQWSPGIGDPTVLGWVTVVAYFAAALLCYRAEKNLRHPAASSTLAVRERFIWLAFFLVLLALGVNKQLDLQTAMTEFFRIQAKQQGWYEVRRQYQRAFIEVLIFATMLASGLLVLLTWRLSQALKIAGIGLCLVFGYVLIRAISFHAIDLLIGKRILGARVNWILELGGLAVVILGARSQRAGLRKSP